MPRLELKHPSHDAASNDDPRPVLHSLLNDSWMAESMDRLSRRAQTKRKIELL